MRNTTHGIAAAALLLASLAGPAIAQTSTGAAPTTNNNGNAGSGMSPLTSPGTTPAPSSAATSAGNGAVNTSPANAMIPASGANSFTRGEARRRIMKQGFTQIMALKKDHEGVWRGKAMKDGQSVSVWLDYRGNIGQQ